MLIAAKTADHTASQRITLAIATHPSRRLSPPKYLFVKGHLQNTIQFMPSIFKNTPKAFLEALGGENNLTKKDALLVESVQSLGILL
jgi:hypothetical protein